MAITLWNLFEASLLCLNAVCILHEERFLAKIGWSSKSPGVHGFGENPSAKAQFLNLIHSIRTVARSFLMHILINYPNLMQDLCSEIVLELIDLLLQPKYQTFINQVICPIVISPAVTILQSDVFGQLCCIRGVLNEYTLLQKFVLQIHPARIVCIAPFRRCSNWRCHAACPESKRCCIYKKFPKKLPICTLCGAKMHEETNGRNMGTYIEGGLIDMCQVLAGTITTRLQRFRAEDCRITTMELGIEYILTGIRMNTGFEVWGCDTFEEALSLQVVPSNRLELLRLRLQNDPWAFVDLLSKLLGAKQFLSHYLSPLRTGLLLSLASTKTPRPVHVLAVCKDYDAGLSLMLDATRLAARCVKCNRPLTRVGVTYDGGRKRYVGDALTLASRGVCYLGNWDPYAGKRGFPVLEAVQYGRIPVEGADGEHVPLKCAVWTILEQPNTRRQTEQLQTLSQVFGIVWTTSMPPEDEEEEFIDLILTNNLTDPTEISDDEIKEYLNSTSNYKVDLTEEAVELVQKYFVSVRRIRGENLPLTSLEPLTSLAEAHARLNRRTSALIEDVMVAIHLCELSLGPCLAFPPAPTDMRSFQSWFATHILQSSVSYDNF